MRVVIGWKGSDRNAASANTMSRFECVCFHPLFCFNQFGDCEGAVLRPDKVHSADGWQEFIGPIVERYLREPVRLLLRADAACAKPEIYEYLEREASAMPSGFGPTRCCSEK